MAVDTGLFMTSIVGDSLSLSLLGFLHTRIIQFAACSQEMLGEGGRGGGGSSLG